MKGNDKMKKLIINYITRKYDIKQSFKKRLMKKDINIIYLLKICYHLEKNIKNYWQLQYNML